MKDRKIKVTDARERKFYINCLHAKNIPVSEFKMSDKRDFSSVINDSLSRHFKDNFEPKEETVKWMREQWNLVRLASKELSWINKKEERLCYFIWCIIRQLSTQDAAKIYSMQVSLGRSADMNSPALLNDYNIYESLRLPTSLTSIDERYETIIDFFDLWILDVDRKRVVLKYIKEKWSQRYSSDDTFNWLDSGNEEQCKWAWKYLKAHEQIDVDFIDPCMPSELYNAVVSAIDYWEPIAPEIKELFLMKMKKSLGQKKHRDKQTDRKNYNFVLSIHAKEKLDQLASHHNKKKNEMLEFMINREFSKLE